MNAPSQAMFPGARARVEALVWIALLATGCHAEPTEPAAAASAAVPASPMAAGLRFSESTRHDYHFTSESQASMLGGEELMDMKLEGELQVSAVRVDAATLELALTVQGLKAETHKPGAQVQLDALPAQLARPAFATYEAGRLVELRLTPDSDNFAEAIVRSLAAALQFSPGRGTWQATEHDGTGSYVARYEQLEQPGQYAKTKLRYEAQALTAPGDPRGQASLAARVDSSSGQLSVRDGVLESLTQKETLGIELGASGQLRSSATLQLKRLRTGPGQAPDAWAALRAGTEPRKALQPNRATAPSPALDEARIAGRSFAQALQALETEARNRSAAEPPVRSTNGEPIDEDRIAERERALADGAGALQLMAALLRQQPEHLPALAQTIRTGSAGQLNLIWALGAAGSSQSQGTLLELAGDASLPKNLRKTAAFSLSRVARPTSESVHALEAYRSDPDFRIVALYGLGTYVRRLREAGDAAGSARISTLLQRDLQQSQSDADRVQILRALFNAADPDSHDLLVSYLAHDDETVRGAAVDALGQLSVPGVDALLARTIEKDASAHVRSTALDTVRHRSYSPALASALDSAARADTETRCRSKALKTLGRWLPEHPELRAVLEHVAANDAREQLRSAAQRILEG